MLTYDVSYFRIDRDHVPMHRYVAPENPMMIAVVGYNDRHTLNMALMCSYIISYEPKNFKGRLKDFPKTLSYGKKIDALRRKYSAYLWSGEFRHTVGARMTVRGNRQSVYSVFMNKANHKRAVVVINPDPDKDLHFSIKLKPPARTLQAASPEQINLKNTNGREKLKPLSAKVFIEK
jgi:hypothetical protein